MQQMKIRKTQIVLILCFLTACINDTGKTVSNWYSSKPEFIRLNHDTITASGWRIEYLTKQDSSDLFINWTKNNINAQYIDSGVLKLRSDFVPHFGAENESNIFMPHRCASDCEALLVLSKTLLKARDFSHLVSYTAKFDKALTVHASSYEIDDGTYKIVLTDLKTFMDTILQFKNLALGSFKVGYIDSIRFEEVKLT